MRLSATWFISLGYVLTLFLFRPGALGQNFATFGLALTLVLTGAYCLFAASRGLAIISDRRLPEEIGLIAVLGLVYLVYETIITVSFGQSVLEFQVKENVLALVVIACYGLFLVNARNNDTFFRQFTTVVSLLGWSSLVTLILAQYFGLSTFELFRVQMQGYEGDGPVGTGTVYFPLSMVYAQFTTADLVLIRFNGFFREAGIYQAVAAFCLVLASLKGRSLYIRAGLIVGIVLTFSTAGIAMLFVAVGASYFLKHRFRLARFAVAAVVFFAGAYVVINAPLIGLMDKVTTHGSSVNDRVTAIANGFEGAAENPLGYGPYRPGVDHRDVTLLAAIGSIGVLGFLLQLALLSGWRGRLDRPTLVRLAACSPLLLTALLSQPIAGSAMLYALVMVRPVRTVQLANARNTPHAVGQLTLENDTTRVPLRSGV